MDVKIQLQQIFQNTKYIIFPLHHHVPGGSDGMAYIIAQQVAHAIQVTVNLSGQMNN